MENPEVVFLSAPYTFPPSASLALSMFKARLAEEGMRASVYYPMFRMMQLMGEELCRRLSNMTSTTLFEEFIFAHLTGMRGIRSPEEFAAAAAGRDPRIDPGQFTRLLREAMAAAETCTEEAAQRIVSLRPRLLAASSLFTQNNGSLAILKRVRELDPDIRTMLGGVNCSGGAGAAILCAYPQVDAVFFGEGDEGIAQACRALITGDMTRRPEGLLLRGEPIPEVLPHPMTRDMNKTPIPDYSDFLLQKDAECPPEMRSYLPESGLGPLLLVEGSRGCWWGEKRACSFCGLNGEKNVYRAKAPERLFEEIRQLSERYGTGTFELTDNVLSRETVRALPPLLKTLDRELLLVAEVRAGLTEQELKNLSDAGFHVLQAGIETLQDHMLSLMGKGGSALGNVAFMKYCMRNDVDLIWNLLYAIPGERAEDYEEMTALLPKLTHLRPPNGPIPILYQKYSRYHSAPEDYGLELKPCALYPYIYGDNAELIEKAAFYYDLTGGETAALFKAHEALHQALREAVAAWLAAWNRETPPRLTVGAREGYLVITDTRACRRSNGSFLQGAEAALCAVCDAPVSLHTILEKLGGQYTEKRIRQALDWMTERGYVIGLGGKYLFLALPEDPNDQR